MTNDLPDFTTSVETGAMEASSLSNGADAAKPAAPSVGDVYIATDTGKGYICLAAGAWTWFMGKLGLATQSEPARAIDGTEYENTGGKIKLVVVSVELQVTSSGGGGSSQITAHIGSASPPATLIDEAKLQAKGALADDIEAYGKVVFIVPVDYFYKVTASNAGLGVAPNLLNWIEYDLF